MLLAASVTYPSEQPLLQILADALNKNKSTVHLQKIIDEGVDAQEALQLVLHYAKPEKRRRLTSRLIEKGANINQKDKKGNTILHNINEPEIVRFLLSFPDIDLTVCNKQNQTPLDVARYALGEKSLNKKQRKAYRESIRLFEDAMLLKSLRQQQQILEQNQQIIKNQETLLQMLSRKDEINS